jgi:phenylalanine-4-hydroxylase
MFWKHDTNLTHIESKPNLKDDEVSFAISFQGDRQSPMVQKLLSDLERDDDVVKVELAGQKVVPWFPRKIQDLDSFSQKTLDAGAELESDHPGFKDMEYRTRRTNIVQAASTYKNGQSIPRQIYSADEIRTWGVVYNKLKGLFPQYACKEFNTILPLLETHCGYAPDNIPQLEDISQFLKNRTGFTLRPVAGLLSARDFLNALAFRVFFSTQYIRHHSMPLYTPEPG